METGKLISFEERIGRVSRGLASNPDYAREAVLELARMPLGEFVGGEAEDIEVIRQGANEGIEITADSPIGYVARALGGGRGELSPERVAALVALGKPIIAEYERMRK